MAARLDEYEHSNLARIMFEKKRIETIITRMHDAVIGLDEKKNILFANPVARRLLKAEEMHLVGKYATAVATWNDMMGELVPEPPPKIGRQTWRDRGCHKV